MTPNLTQQNRTQLFFNYFMDCQTPQKPGGAPDQTWEVAEASVRGIMDLFEEEGLIRGLGLCSEPEVAARQPELFNEVPVRGAWEALHFQVRGYRPLGATQDYDWERPMTFYDYDEQLEAITLAKDHWEQALERTTDNYGACCCQANDWTMPILNDLGFRQCYVGGPGRYNPDSKVGHFWWGAFPYSHHASSQCRLVPGSLKLYNVTVTVELFSKQYGPETWRPMDYRPENEFDYERTLATAEAWVRDMMRSDHPLLYLCAATHNTWDVADKSSPRRRALKDAIRASREVANRLGLELVPASLADLHAEADRLNAF